MSWSLMSWTELLAFITGVVSVLLFGRQKVAAWPIGIANSLVWLLLFWHSRLYFDSSLQFVYIVLGFLGWFWWVRGGPAATSLSVAHTGRREAAVLTALTVVGTAVLWFGQARWTNGSLPFWDSSTTVVSLVAQYMLTRMTTGLVIGTFLPPHHGHKHPLLARPPGCAFSAPSRRGRRRSSRRRPDTTTPSGLPNLRHRRVGDVGLAPALPRSPFGGGRCPGSGARHYTLYILTSDDIPFVQDGTRDGEHRRSWMTQRFREELDQRPEPWIEVGGTHEHRVVDAGTAIDSAATAQPPRY